MATLVLQAAGAFVGTALGGPVGAIIGQAAGALAGNIFDRQLISTIGAKDSFGPRLARMPAINASEGAAVARVYGRARVGGSLVWTTRFEEVATTQRVGGTGGKGSRPSSTSYSYFGNFAIALCEGPISEIRRIWADGKELDQTEYTIRVYAGDESQQPDPLIIAKEGVDNAPAYRGIAYAVFERMPLVDFGNRIPLFSFEVVRSIDTLAEKITAVCVIPGSSEYGYETNLTLQYLQPGVTVSENRHQLMRSSDWTASLDSLQALCPNLKSVALVVTWFGDDLRAGECNVEPRVENSEKTTNGEPWLVAGLNRQTANIVSQYDGKPAFGGTPSDSAVVSAIQDLNERGLNVVFYPFLMMDIPHDNSLPDPWNGGTAQPPYPWRGRVTCHPAPGQPATVDATPTASTQINQFFGSATPGPSEFSYRRFILHYANLCVQAGGVGSFLIGSEIVSLTRVRSGSEIYPAPNQLVALADDVRVIAGVATRISYAADWTEYSAHVLDGGNEVRFPLDPLWSATAIDFVGIDVYWPMTDWRDEEGHLDEDLASSIYDSTYLKSRLTAGEAFDWHYVDDSAREAQSRTPIGDGSAGKPWVFRAKDIRGWWQNPHYERVSAQELAQPTGWVPESKPIWFTEIGCPAVDKGSNAPNVFPDKKSSENNIPPFSTGSRDDLIQKRVLEAIIDTYSPQSNGFIDADNPVSSVYGARMVESDQIHIWAWDARPFPAFPALSDVWADADAWETGHWINGRLEAAPTDSLFRALVGEIPDLDPDLINSKTGSILDGYIIDLPMSPRRAIEPLLAFCCADVVISGGAISFVDRRCGNRLLIDEDDLALSGDDDLVVTSRSQESELSRAITISVHDGDRDYQTITGQSRRLEGFATRETSLDIPVVCARNEVKRRAEVILQDMWVGRETIVLGLPPSRIDIEVGDHLAITTNGVSREFRVTEIEDGLMRRINGRAIQPEVFQTVLDVQSREPVKAPPVFGPPDVRVLDLAIAKNQPVTLQYLAVFADPWPGSMAVWRARGSESYELHKIISKPAIIGTTLSDFLSGPASRYDQVNQLTIELTYGALPGLSVLEQLAAKSAIAIQGADKSWEIIAYRNAELIGSNQYRLTNFIRGLGGQTHLSQRTVAAGAAVVLLDDAVIPLTGATSDINVSHIYKIGPARRDYSDPSYVQSEFTASNLALLPYAPVHIKARRVGGDIIISFIRRSRVESDTWENVEVPLGEAAEKYEIEIISAGNPVRTVALGTTSFTYESADEITDFGSVQTQIDVRIFQISETMGRGIPFSGTLDIT